MLSSRTTESDVEAQGLSKLDRETGIAQASLKPGQHGFGDRSILPADHETRHPLRLLAVTKSTSSISSHRIPFAKNWFLHMSLENLSRAKKAEARRMLEELLPKARLCRHPR
jgi:hypothetical protein